ncbi:MAG TPA: DNA-directed DNA polymerase II small subunit [Nitrosopumilaceae archaeon]
MEKDVVFAINYALNKGFQIHPDALKIIERVDVNELERVIKQIIREKTKQKLFSINQNDLEVVLGLKDDEKLESEYRVLSDPSPKITSAEGVEGYGMLFESRFMKLKKIISNRPEAKMLKTISSAVSSKSNDDMYICGLLTERRVERNVTKLIIDDPTSSIETIIFDQDLQKIAASLLTDQFVMGRISLAKNGGFIMKDIIVPDIPEHIPNRSKTETYAAFLSDLHIGSMYFMEKELNDFISWLSSPDPIARKIRFVLICGDVVDGVGIYPNQDKELDCVDIHEQLKKTAELLSKIPQHIKIFVTPGNHDPGRRALPQPAIPQIYNSDLWNKKNIFMLGNPAMISLNGVKVLMFHGQSIDDVVRTTPGLSFDKPALVMKYLLQARHLSPIYGSQTPLAPEIDDMMIIEDIPDIFHAGHVHVVDLDLYRGVLILNSGAWQHQTPFQAGVGITPTPGMAVIVNLKTFKVYTKSFTSKD